MSDKKFTLTIDGESWDPVEQQRKKRKIHVLSTSVGMPSETFFEDNGWLKLPTMTVERGDKKQKLYALVRIVVDEKSGVFQVMNTRVTFDEPVEFVHEISEEKPVQQVEQQPEQKEDEEKPASRQDTACLGPIKYQNVDEARAARKESLLVRLEAIIGKDRKGWNGYSNRSPLMTFATGVRDGRLARASYTDLENWRSMMRIRITALPLHDVIIDGLVKELNAGKFDH